MEDDHVDPTLGSEPQLGSTSWLCRDNFDRERMLDMQERMYPARRRAYALLAIALVATGPWLGWWPLLVAVPAVACFKIADSIAPRLAAPEYLMFASWIVSALAIAGVVALSGGAHSPMLSWLAIPVLTLSSRFSMRGVLVGIAVILGLLTAILVGDDGHSVAAGPALFIAPFALIVSITVLSMPLMRSDMQHRSDSVVDQLTGLLNRKALSVRVVELVQQSRLTGEPVGLIIGDVDHFKRVNDTHGHAVGDAVLKNVAYVLRKQLRAFDLAYRLGGEEFVVLLPGSDLTHTAELAERLREAVSADETGPTNVAMSFGVSASERAETFEYATVFAKADAALYRAKQNGRDQVCLAERDVVPAPGLAPSAATAPMRDVVTDAQVARV